MLEILTDFSRFYNKTKFSGLETHIANSYMNPLLQMYKFTPLLRNLALQHTATACTKEDCMLCQMGFLFDMLDKANGQNCQATNFLKTFSSLSTGMQSSFFLTLLLSLHVVSIISGTNKGCPLLRRRYLVFSCQAWSTGGRLIK